MVHGEPPDPTLSVRRAVWHGGWCTCPAGSCNGKVRERQWQAVATPNPLPPIADYGLIGDGRTAALCSSAGSIDWMCLPRFDSHPVFGRLIGGRKAGSFSIRPHDVRAVIRRYREGSSVLETRWSTSSGEVLVTEGLVLHVGGRLVPPA